MGDADGGTVVSPPEVSRTDHSIVWSSVAALAAGILLFFGFGALGLEDSADHLTSHLAFGVPALALLSVAIKKWPRPHDDRYGRVTRRILIAGLAITGIGQLVEGIGAFDLDPTHDVGLMIGTLGLLILMLGIGLSLMVSLARRIGIIETRWMPILVGVVVTGVVLFVVGSFIFGY